MDRGISDAEVALREARILQSGLPCRLTLRRNGEWSCLDIEPLPGFLHLCADEVYVAHVERGEPYHMSLGYDIEAALLEELERCWGGREVVIEVKRFTANHVAVLAWRGLGADADAWAAFGQGYPYKWSFGFHISM